MLNNIFIKYIITFFISMTPVIELRGAIPFAVGALHLSYFEAFMVSLIGNIVPIYFIVKYIGPIFDFLGRFKIFKKIIDWSSNRAIKKIEESNRLQNYTAFGLFIFVAIPLPGTGAWIGSLIANFLHIPLKKAFWPIALGVFTAGVIILSATAIISGGIQVLFVR